MLTPDGTTSPVVDRHGCLTRVWLDVQKWQCAAPTLQRSIIMLNEGDLASMPLERVATDDQVQDFLYCATKPVDLAALVKLVPAAKVLPTKAR
jgi:hypothetical protein